MNFSLLVIFLLVGFIVLLVWQFFAEPPKQSESSLTESRINDIKKNKHLRQNSQPYFSSSSFIDSSLDSSLLYPVLEKAEVVRAIRQRELSFESIIRIMAPQDENFMGYTLLQGLQNTGMRYGERGLFYYDIEDRPIFSISPMGAPIFDIENIGVFQTPGLILTLKDCEHWNTMQDKANILAEELGGEIKC